MIILTYSTWYGKTTQLNDPNSKPAFGIRFLWLNLTRSCMAMHIVGRCLVALSITMVLLTAGCTSFLSSGDVQTHADTYPRSPLKIVAPIQYEGTSVNGSGAITALIINFTVAPAAIFSSDPAQDPEINITRMAITFTDGQNLFFFEQGEYHISQRDGEDDNHALGPGEVAEVILTLPEPIPVNSDVHADFWIPSHGTLTLSFRTPDPIESSGQVTEFTAAPFSPY